MISKINGRRKMSLQQQEPKAKLKLIASITNSAIGLLASVVTLATLFSTISLATLVAWLARQKNVLLPLASFALGFCLSLLLVVILLYFSKSAYISRLSRGYKTLSIEHLYCINDTLEQHIMISTFTIKIIRSGLIIFRDSYNWSGHGKEEPPEVLSAEHELMGSFTKDRFYFKRKDRRHYYIYLGSEYPVGKEVEVKIKNKFYDIARRFEPFLSTPIYSQLRSLKLGVLLPKVPHVTNYNNYYYRFLGANSKLVSK